MARNASIRRKLVVTAFAWTVGLVIFFPILWTVLTSFKTEGDAINIASFFSTGWTTEAYSVVQSRSNYVQFAMNSVILALGSTFFALVIAIPSAWAMAFAPGKRTKDLLMWMLSTKMMPPVGVLIPMYLLFKNLGLLDTVTGLLIIYTLINLPIVIWMLYTYFKDVPGEILEAGRVDGAKPMQELFLLLIPLAVPGIASTGLLSVILSWNEAFWSLNLTSSQGAPLTAFIASFSSPQGLFWAKLSAASLMAIAPILVVGWMSQRQLVSGLTFGAVK